MDTESRSRKAGQIMGGYLAIASVCLLVVFLILVVIMVFGGRR